MFFTHVQELFGNVILKQVTKPLRWSNMATMPTLPETQENIKEEIRRQVYELSLCFTPKEPAFALTLLETDDDNYEELLFIEYFLKCAWSYIWHILHGTLKPEIFIWHC